MTVPRQRDPDLMQLVNRLASDADDSKRAAIARWGLVPHVTADPASPPDGSIWVRDDLGQLRFRAGGVTRVVGGRFLVDSRLADGGDTGNVAGATTVLMASTGALSLTAGDLVVVTGTAWMICTVAALFAGTRVYINGVDTGRGVDIDETTGTGRTLAVRPTQTTIGATGSYTFDHYLSVPAACNIRAVQSSMLVQIFRSV